MSKIDKQKGELKLKISGKTLHILLVVFFLGMGVVMGNQVEDTHTVKQDLRTYHKLMG